MPYKLLIACSCLIALGWILCSPFGGGSPPNTTWNPMYDVTGTQTTGSGFSVMWASVNGSWLGSFITALTFNYTILNSGPGLVIRSILLVAVTAPCIVSVVYAIAALAASVIGSIFGGKV